MVRRSYVLHGLCSASCSSHLTLLAQASRCSLAGDLSLPFVNFFSSSNLIKSNLSYTCSYRLILSSKKIILIHLENRNKDFFFLNAVRRVFPVSSAPGSTATERQIDIPSQSSTARALFKKMEVSAFRLRKA